MLVRMRATMMLAVWAVISVAGCNKDGTTSSPCSAISLGTCHTGSVACGIAGTCNGQRTTLECTPPTASDAKTIDCVCVENSVRGKAVQLDFVSAASPFRGNGSEILSTACGK